MHSPAWKHLKSPLSSRGANIVLDYYTQSSVEQNMKGMDFTDITSNMNTLFFRRSFLTHPLEPNLIIIPDILLLLMFHYAKYYDHFNYVIYRNSHSHLKVAPSLIQDGETPTVFFKK